MVVFAARFLLAAAIILLVAATALRATRFVAAAVVAAISAHRTGLVVVVEFVHNFILRILPCYARNIGGVTKPSKYFCQNIVILLDILRKKNYNINNNNYYYYKNYVIENF